MTRLATLLIVALAPLAIAQEKKANPKAPAKPAGPPPTMENVPYGTHPRQVLDFYQAKSRQADAASCSAIHGGGWVNGDKSSYRGAAKRFLDDGISVVAINYRLVTQAAEDKVEPPVKWPLEDAARALQFVRSKAKEWNIDKKRIGATGGSAGGVLVAVAGVPRRHGRPQEQRPRRPRIDPAVLRGGQRGPDHARPEGAARVDAELPLRRPRLRLPQAENRDGAFQEFFEQREKLLPWIKEYSPIDARDQGRPAGVPGLPEPEEAAGEGRGAGRPDALGPARHDPDGEAEGGRGGGHPRLPRPRRTRSTRPPPTT